ncbi:lysophospholipid acyltransferase family protein [Anaeromyxobacter sp. K]|uniref:lysophospholipid acyltransferase family protein n=1 Tax=Anaeromyxobacter sp. (strain K) TaxID=447217 RepID=UPI00015FA00A|nr:lysophospholipid acyltransferase family protein [Anaeromyxobacter sp. K]
MAGGTGKRKAAGRRGAARPPGAARPAPRPVLGNDPFTRGAAPRPPASPPSPAPSSGPPPAPAVATVAAVAPAPPAPSPAPAPAAAAGASPPAAEAPARAPERTRTLPADRTGAQARLADVERRLDSALDGLEARVGDLAARAGLAGARREVTEAVARLAPAVAAKLGAALDLARLLEPPERLDRHGMDPRLVERAEPLVELLYATWWRTTVRDAEHVPATGPVMVVANHAGVVPWDALVLRHALRRDHPARRELRPLLDDRECDLPVVGGLAVRLGAVRATPEAAGRILAEGGALGVFPEGSAGARKPWGERYRLQRFGRGGFVKVALRAGATLVPCAIVGSEEAAPGISRTGWLADRLGLPLLTASPLLRLAPAALLPLPSRWSLRFGPPIPLAGRSPAEAEDPARVGELAETVRATLQGMLDEDVSARGSVFL